MTAPSIIRNFWSLLRPQTFLLMLVYVAFGLSSGLADSTQPFDITIGRQLMLVYLALAGWYAAGTGLNDYADYEIDRVNLAGDRQRPLVRQTISHRGILRLALTCTSLSLVCASLTANLRIISLFGLLLTLNAVYSLQPVQLSRRGGLAQLLLPLGYAVLTFNSGYLIGGGRYGLAASLVNLGLYIHFIARLLLKDHRDIIGDRQAGKITPVIRYGNTTVVRIALGLFIISTILLSWTIEQTSRHWHVAVLFTTLFAGGAVMSLQLLSQEARWPYQKPLITIFGRCCSGLIVVCLVTTVGELAGFTVGQLGFMLGLVSLAFFASLFDILRLQHPAFTKV